MSQTLCLLFLTIAPTALRAAIINVPADQPTIQAGINAANPGDTVLIAPGTYYENINFFGKAITVTSSGGAAKTIIDGSAKAPVVSFTSQETRASVLSNLTVRNGGAFNNSTSGIAWGGIYTTHFSNPTILNNLIIQNACNGYYGSGSALLQGNTISGTTFSSAGNCPLALGAGIFIFGGDPPYASVIGNIIENNVQPSAFNSGAILLNAAGSPVIENNIIRNNAMTGIHVINMNALTFVQNLVYGNVSQDAAGGMDVLVPFVLPGPVTGVIANNTFVANTGISASYSASQVHLDGSLSQFDFVNNIVIGTGPNAAFLCGYPPADANSITPLVIDHNDIYNASGPAYGTNCPDQTGTYGNLSTDPLFTNPAAADFHLKSGSPAIDAGNTSVQDLPTKDLDGNPRLQDATGKGYPIVDMGAYELSGLTDANATTIVLTPSLYEVPGGTSIALTAKLLSANGIPTGAVTFVEDNSTIGSSVIDPTGTASFSTAGLTPGIHGFIATYPGQSAFTPAVSVQIFVRVDVYVPALTITSTPNPSYQNQLVTFTAVVSPFASPVVFTDGASTLATLTPNSAGVAIFTTSTLAIGSHVITGKYPGDPYHSAASASVTQQILAPLINTATTLTATPNPANTLQTVTLTTAVSTGTAKNATGTITFFDGTTALGTSSLDANGHATFITSTLATGTHTLNAVYSGDTSFATSTSNNITETIAANPTFTTLSISPTQSQAFQFFTVTVGVSSLTSVPFSPQSCSPICTVTLTITGLPNNQNSTVSAPVLGSGTAAFKYALAVGTYSFSATFNGSSAFAPSTSGSLSETVPPATTLTLAASPTTANQNQSVAFTSVLTAPLSTEIPSGTITLLDGATPFTTAPFTGNPLSNTATINAATTTLVPGTHIITATYPGSPNFLPATSAPITIIINPNDYALSTPTSHPIIPTEHHLAIPVNLSSIGVFSDQVTLACTNLPVWTTCTFDQNTLQLTAGGTATTNLTIDTSSVLRYARNQTPNTGTRTASSIAFALTLPAGILGLFITRRRKLPLRLTLFFLTTLAATLTLTGCTGMYPLATPPGAYTFNITANGTTTGLSHFITISLTVNP